MKLIKCPRCGEQQMRIEPGEDSNKKDAVCAYCHLIVPLRDLKTYDN